MEPCMFDTVIFNRIVDGFLDVSVLMGKVDVYVTHIQRDELNSTSNAKRRELLQKTFHEVSAETVPTESAVFDVSRFDEARFGTEDGLYLKIKVALDAKKLKQNNIQDALIAETAIVNGFTLVTDDRQLAEIVQTHCGKAIDSAQLQKMLSPADLERSGTSVTK